jgi:isoleucyl-tRNA synthetase
MDYSNTVNLPLTDFPMKANLPQREPQILKKWEDDLIYRRILDSRKEAPLYILHDGPPYANGHIHLGHALNKILKDIIVKHKTMLGMRAPYVPGWDCHGLPIELQVTKDLGSEAHSIQPAELRKKCRVYADKFVKIQMEEFKRLGVFADYENPYKTMSPEYESAIVNAFAAIFEKGYIYRSKKPIYWCPTCVTALAEAEVEYGDHVSDSIYVKFPVEPGTLKVEGVDPADLFAVIWTTTPWTLPANLAVCLHPDLAYSAVKFGSEFYIIADGLIESMEGVMGKGADGIFPLTMDAIEKMKVRHPFIDRESKVIFGGHVTLEQGTGIVHTAPGHGYDDYIVGLKYGLDVFCPVDDHGKFDDGFPEMKGIHVFKANPLVIDLLKEKGVLIRNSQTGHSYPHCWRCKKPLIFRATEQWFLSIDHNDMRKTGLESVDKTEWIPSWGEGRFRSMVETRPDWCLSRQRSWGVPIPSFRCADCGKNNMSADSIKHFAELASEQSIDIWYTLDNKALIPAGTKCSCGSSEFIREFDILDVWFDSGVSHFAVLDNRDDLRWPADLYLEGSDQHRGWFQSSLWPALAVKGKAPYKTVLTHGFVLDSEGKAMSKSQGNVIPPEKLISQYGADIVRLWVSSEDYRNDLRIGMDMMNQIADSYRRIRNTFKFIIGNISDLTEKDALPYVKLADIDKWILHHLAVLSERVIEHYEKYEFHLVYRRILNFCAVDLSSIYFDVSKDILYIEPENSAKRRSNQTALSAILETLLRLVAPVLAFTAEEVWQFMEREGTLHTQAYLKTDSSFMNPELASRMETVVNIKKDVLKALEAERKNKTLKGSLEAEVSIYTADQTALKIMKDMGDELKRFLQVAAITILSEKIAGLTDYDTCSVSASKSTGEKCVRCWNYSASIGSDSAHPELCPRCAGIVKEIL